MNNEELLCKLISYKTYYNNKEEFTKCFDFIENYLKESKLLNIKKCIFNDNISMIISNTKSKKYDIVFLGHIDVVNASEKQFNAKIIDTKIYGRGSFDLKGHDSVMINIMKKIDRSKKVALILTSDEERGGFYGIPKIMENNLFTSKLAIVPDGGNNFDFITEEKGVLQLKITAYGTSAHASKPYEGDNAIIKLFNVYNRLIEKYPLPNNSNEYKTSINLGTISGGKLVNVVPDCCSMMLDIRHTYTDSKKDIINYIKKIDKNIKIEIFAEGETYKANIENEYVKKYIKICEVILNRKIKYKPCESASDARFFQKYGINAIIMNGYGNNMHSNNEYIEIRSLDILTQIYKRIIEEI